MCSKFEVFFALVSFICAVAGQAGDSCTTKTGQPGVCTNIRKCQSAIDDIKKRINPQICGFQQSDPVVCCTQGSQPGGTVTTSSQRPVTSGLPSVDYTYVDTPSECEKIPSDRTAQKTGRKAFDKCIEYQERVVYPCVSSPALAPTSGRVRVNRCGHSADGLIVGGEDTTPREFPHMALLGFGPQAESAAWQCAGSLISEWYIVTAGHCTYSREFGDVTFARLGAHKRTDRLDNNVYGIAQIIKHPNYKPPSKYNDIALLRTDREVTLNQFAVPICLDVGGLEIPKVTATGWGSMQYKGPLANTMQKVVLEKFTTQECDVKFPVTRLMRSGFNASSQLCYGSKVKSVDTCQGDSGGPIQVTNKQIDCMYLLVGITSFGKACGFVGDPGIYTRVENYTPWIESIVW